MEGSEQRVGAGGSRPGCARYNDNAEMNLALLLDDHTNKWVRDRSPSPSGPRVVGG